MAYGLGGLGGFGGGYGNQSFVCHLAKYIGETVTIFTTSGGASGCGFSGVLLSVNCNFVRISTLQGTPPANPLSTVICGGLNNGGCTTDSNVAGGNVANDCYGGYGGYGGYNVGSVCDIPIDRIASFCHNAI